MESIIISPKKLNYALFMAFSENCTFNGEKVEASVDAKRDQYVWTADVYGMPQSFYFDRSELDRINPHINIRIIVGQFENALRYWRSLSRPSLS